MSLKPSSWAEGVMPSSCMLSDIAGPPAHGNGASHTNSQAQGELSGVPMIDSNWCCLNDQGFFGARVPELPIPFREFG